MSYPHECLDFFQWFSCKVNIYTNQPRSPPGTPEPLALLNGPFWEVRTFVGLVSNVWSWSMRTNSSFRQADPLQTFPGEFEQDEIWSNFIACWFREDPPLFQGNLGTGVTYYSIWSVKWPAKSSRQGGWWKYYLLAYRCMIYGLSPFFQLVNGNWRFGLGCYVILVVKIAIRYRPIFGRVGGCWVAVVLLNIDG